MYLHIYIYTHTSLSLYTYIMCIYVYRCISGVIGGSTQADSYSSGVNLLRTKGGPRSSRSEIRNCGFLPRELAVTQRTHANKTSFFLTVTQKGDPKRVIRTKTEVTLK